MSYKINCFFNLSYGVVIMDDSYKLFQNQNEGVVSVKKGAAVIVVNCYFVVHDSSC